MKIQNGFSLIESVIVIIVIGILVSGTLFFLKKPIDIFESQKERTKQVSQIQIALGGLKNEIRNSLPNSIRIQSVSGVSYFEFVPIEGGGRYRAAARNGGADSTIPACSIDQIDVSDNSRLEINRSDTCFKTIGSADLNTTAVNDWLVIFNLGGSFSNANVYEFGPNSGGNRTKIRGITNLVGETMIQFDSISFANGSPGNRFYTVKGPVTLICDLNAKQLKRVSGYAFTATQQTLGVESLSGSQVGVIAKNIESCSFNYNPSGINSQLGLVSINLQLSNLGGEIINIFMQTQVSNGL